MAGAQESSNMKGSRRNEDRQAASQAAHRVGGYEDSIGQRKLM